jgi:sulfate transport system substrate-binding protein
VAPARGPGSARRAPGSGFSAGSDSGHHPNVSCDIARELFAQITPAFVAAWKARTLRSTSRTAPRRVGPLPCSRTAGRRRHLQPGARCSRSCKKGTGWSRQADRTGLPHGSSLYYSLPVFLVREDVQAVFPNPKISGNARYTYLPAYAHALR